MVVVGRKEARRDIRPVGGTARTEAMYLLSRVERSSRSRSKYADLPMDLGDARYG